MSFSNRRSLLKAAACLPLIAFPGLGLAASGGRELRFSHLHTGEKLRVTYFEGGRYLQDALAEVNYLLRDFRSGDIHAISPALLDFVYQVQTQADSRGTLEIISGYRSPATNEMLRDTTDGVAKRSRHMDGEALDIRLTDVSTASVQQIAIALQQGGVGYYPDSDFVHIDVGPVRQW